jgi:hypothetical protein
VQQIAPSAQVPPVHAVPASCALQLPLSQIWQVPQATFEVGWQVRALLQVSHAPQASHLSPCAPQ